MILKQKLISDSLDYRYPLIRILIKLEDSDKTNYEDCNQVSPTCLKNTTKVRGKDNSCFIVDLSLGSNLRAQMGYRPGGSGGTVASGSMGLVTSISSNEGGTKQPTGFATVLVHQWS